MRNRREFSRRTIGGIAVLVGLAVFTCLAASVFAQQEPVMIGALKKNFLMHHKEVVIVQGWVTSEKAVSQTSFKGFNLRDRFGDSILIRTTKPLPGINTEIKVRGVALMDGPVPYIAEEDRDELQKSEVGEGPQVRHLHKDEPSTPLQPAVAPASDPTEPPPSVAKPPQIAATSTLPLSQTTGLGWRWILGGGLVGLALVIGAFVLVVSRRRAGSGVTGIAPSTAEAWQNPYVPTAASSPSDVLRPAAQPAQDTVIEDFKTVKAFKTSKVLPGRLIVMENQQETDVIHLSDQSGRGEIEIGRDSPDATGGIRIKDKTNTLSRRQARLMYSSATREFKLHNLVGEGGNPTVHNGRVMHENETTLLKDGDVLGMGSVDLMFRHK